MNPKEHTMLTITHTHEAGTILEGTSRGDGSNLALKSAGGWRWSRTLGAWYVPQSRDRDAKDHHIDRAARALREAGFEVEVTVDNTARPVAEVVADQTERLHARGDRLEARAERKAVDADRAEEHRRAMLARVPEGGEPIKVGHHSETRHRNAIDKSWNALGKSVEADRAATRAAEAAEASRVNTAVKDSPRAVLRRVERLRTEVGKWQRTVDTLAARGEESPRHTEGLRREQEKLAHWEAVHADNLAAGLIVDYSRDTVSKGDWVKAGGAGWSEVVRANLKTVTVDVSAIFGCKHSLKYDWSQVTDHRTAAQVAALKDQTASA